MRPVDCCVFVVGCGGIGGYLCELLPQVMACINLDRNSNVGNNETLEALNSEGINNHVQNVFKKLVLIDGDDFSGHNALRQQAVHGSKLVVQMNKIRNKDAFTTWLNDTELKGYQTFIKPENADHIFLKETRDSCCDSVVVFLCVDNHKTRFEVSKYFESFDRPVLIINGGNKKVSGNVTIWAKKWGTMDHSYFDPPIYKVYPEVNDKHDLRPDEVDCGTVTLNNDQTAVTNNMIASIMLSMFSKGILKGFDAGFMQETRRKDENGNVIKVRKNEVIVDFNTMTMQSLSHSKDLDNTKLYSILEGAANEEELN